MQGLEPAVVGLPGRQVRRSDREKITTIELDEHMLLPLALAQADLRPQRAGEREVQCGLPDLQGWGLSHPPQQASQQHAYQHPMA